MAPQGRGRDHPPRQRADRTPPLTDSPTELETARRIVAAYDPADAEQRAERDRILAFADEHDDALLRTCVPGHLTGSALVVDHTGTRVLLMLHRKLRRWLQMGGHADGEGDLVAVALREASEESGIPPELLTIDPRPIDVDIHEVPCPPGHDGWHYDTRFLVVAAPDAVEMMNEESLALQWFAFDALPETFHDGDHRMINAARARLRTR